jgi:hypothetical protein
MSSRNVIFPSGKAPISYMSAGIPYVAIAAGHALLVFSLE